VTVEHSHPNGSRTFQLNVVFHGLWAFETKRHGILAHTTKTPHHVFQGGNLGGPMYDLQSGVNYKLVVRPDKGDDKDFEEDENVVLRNKPLADSRERFCTVWLPPATFIQSERKVPVVKKSFAGCDGSKLEPRQVSMVQVFVYQHLEHARIRRLRAWKPDIQPDDTADLHFRAEPQTRDVPCLHSIQSYVQLAEMFGLEIVPVRELFIKAKAPDPPIKGLDQADMELLVEPNDSPGIGDQRPMGLSGSNCDSLVIHNHEKL
jgi:hypothetical protein